MDSVISSDFNLIELHADNPGVIEYYETIHLFIITLTNNLPIGTPLKLSKVHLGDYETDTFQL